MRPLPPTCVSAVWRQTPLFNSMIHSLHLPTPRACTPSSQVYSIQTATLAVKSTPHVVSGFMYNIPQKVPVSRKIYSISLWTVLEEPVVRLQSTQIRISFNAWRYSLVIQYFHWCSWLGSCYQSWLSFCLWPSLLLAKPSPSPKNEFRTPLRMTLFSCLFFV